MKKSKEREANDEIRILDCDARINLEVRQANYANLYEKNGWANLLIFDLKIDDLDVETYVKKT